MRFLTERDGKMVKNENTFELIGEPDTWFIFESEEGEFLAIAEFETV
jgi:hypothetical protein